VKTDRAIVTFHASAVLLSLLAAMVWPRAGQAALMVPVGDGDLGTVLHWAEQEDAPLLMLDTDSGRLVARVPDNRSLLGALRSGIIPIATRASGCQPSRTR